MAHPSGKGFKQLAPRLVKLSRAVVLGAMVLAGPDAASAASLFNVAKVHVDCTARNAVIAREGCVKTAETRAMTVLLQRLVPLGAQVSLPEFAHQEIEGLIAGIAIRSEKASTKRYIGVLDVRFDPGAVRQFLHGRAIPFQEDQAVPITVLPVVLDGDSVDFDASAAWRAAWDRLDLENGVAPVTLVSPRPDTAAKTVRRAFGRQQDAVAALRSVYGYGGLVVALGEFWGEAAEGAFRVRLVGEDAAGDVDRVVTSPAGRPEGKAMEDAAAGLALGALERRWKQRLAPEYGAAPEAPLPRGALYPDAARVPDGEVLGPVGAILEFFSVRDWQQIHFGLQQVDGLRDLAITGRSPRAASVRFAFDGSVDQLEAALAQNGIALYERDGTLVLRAR